MDGGLGGANGFWARTRREEDAREFRREFRQRGRHRRSASTGTLVVVGVLVLGLGVMLVIDLLA